MRLVLIGAPGAGKGTQSSKICKKLNIPHLSTGDIFRSHIKNKTRIGLKVEQLISEGRLVPDEITFEVVREKLAGESCKTGFLMDGFPRTAKQALFLDKLLKSQHLQVDHVINLIVEDSVILKRMTGRRICDGCGESYHLQRLPSRVEGICDSCGGILIQRSDDNPETVLQRLDVYHAQTGPIIDYYRTKGVLIEVTGSDSAQETANQIFKNLGVFNARN